MSPDDSQDDSFARNYFDIYVDVDDDEPDSSPAWEQQSASDSALFNSGLARLFAESMEAGRPSVHLRAVLAQIDWQPISHPGDAIQKKALEQGREFGGRKLKPGTKPVESRVACFRVHETAQQDTVSAPERLSALRKERTADAVLLQYQEQWYGFIFPQFLALEDHLSQQATVRDIESKEAGRLELLLGAGLLEEFLSMPVYYSKGLPTGSGIRGKSMGSVQSQVIRLNTPGFDRGSNYDRERASVRDVLKQLAERTDYDGIQFNTESFDGNCQHSVGPNFAKTILGGTDVRRAPRCPAEPIHQFEFACYLTRWFSVLWPHSRKEVEQALEGARFMLSAIPPEADALPREAVQSLLGAFYLRCKPEFARRKWLEGFIRRCERALAARWRVGVF